MLEVKPAGRCHAVVTIHGSKSYTHRALIAAALASGESLLVNALQCEDTSRTVEGLETFGITVSAGRRGLTVSGKGGYLDGSAERVFVADSGTSMRFLTALSALRRGPTTLDGSARMQQRPMGDLIKGLGALGVTAYCREGNGRPPVIVEPSGLQGGIAVVNGDESSQFVSALLMIAPFATRDVHVQIKERLVSRPYVDMTLNVMSAFGVQIENREYRFFSVSAGQRYLPRIYSIEGDASNASYFFAAAAATRGTVRVRNFFPGSVQGDAGFLNILERMGCEVVRGSDWAEVTGKELRSATVDMNAMPDLVPTLAIVALFARGETVIENIGHLRLKESDRIRSLALELRKMGARVDEGRNWLKIRGGPLGGAELETHRDHRLAMSFAVAGLAVPGVKIKGEESVNKSFPGFWEVFKKLY